MVDHTRRDGPCSSRINCHLEGTAEKKKINVTVTKSTYPSVV